MWDIIGHKRVVSLLQRGIEQGKLAHAYLLVGPPHVGKMTLGLNLARALNCESSGPPCGNCSPCQRITSNKFADVQTINLASAGNPNDKPLTEISIEQIRQVQLSASLPPFEGKFKVFIIDGAEFMSIEAANCLLKTLEEPPEKVIFILLATSEQLPATIISRCQRLELAPQPVSEIEGELIRRGIEPSQARVLARLSHGCPGWAIAAASDVTLLEERAEKLDMLVNIINNNYETRFDYAARLASDFARNRKLVQDVLDLWLDWWRDLLLVKAGNKDSITNIDSKAKVAEQANIYSLAQIRSVISCILAAGHQLRLNASPRLVLEVLMLNIPKKEECCEGSLTSQIANG